MYKAEKSIAGVEEATGYTFKSKKLIKNALTHPSCGEDESYERLEFLGDLIIDAVVGIYLFKKYPQKDESFLTDLKSAYVNKKSLEQAAGKINLHKFAQHNSKKVSNLDDLLEALIGAIYLDGGWKNAAKLINMVILDTEMDPIQNYKNILFTISRKLNDKNPVYRIVKETGPPHKKKYTVKVKIDGKRFVGNGTAFTKKEAEMTAARELLNKLQILDDC